MATETDAKPAALVRLETLIGCADRRLCRAKQRFERAQQELDEAEMDLLRAQSERRDWLEANPPPQAEMPL